MKQYDVGLVRWEELQAFLDEWSRAGWTISYVRDAGDRVWARLILEREAS